MTGWIVAGLVWAMGCFPFKLASEMMATHDYGRPMRLPVWQAAIWPILIGLGAVTWPYRKWAYMRQQRAADAQANRQPDQSPKRSPDRSAAREAEAYRQTVSCGCVYCDIGLTAVRDGGGLGPMVHVGYGDSFTPCTNRHRV